MCFVNEYIKLKYINIKKFCLQGKDMTSCLKSIAYMCMKLPTEIKSHSMRVVG